MTQQQQAARKVFNFITLHSEYIAKMLYQHSLLYNNQAHEALTDF